MPVVEVAPGDLAVVCAGDTFPADGAIDACLDESRAFYEECREDYSDRPGDDAADACASLCE